MEREIEGRAKGRQAAAAVALLVVVMRKESGRANKKFTHGGKGEDGLDREGAVASAGNNRFSFLFFLRQAMVTWMFFHSGKSVSLLPWP